MKEPTSVDIHHKHTTFPTYVYVGKTISQDYHQSQVSRYALYSASIDGTYNLYQHLLKLVFY